ncbi:hypothetical protein N482_06010 [Pseudoalteromonas luteoviolacea NCIMB 1942]|uniref:Transposase DDE domain-containing protein n=1 Tax=Pseudoalteromonas luteoviolacea NCIMB 1942 TaxID=1365253 RepID=A0A162AJE1_9GAMM|nr:hypothetical protein N482_06010 [Pseudoalteromonas luteoviolacea NCIMB 1942]
MFLPQCLTQCSTLQQKYPIYIVTVEEIELGYREQKQYMFGNRLTFRSRLPELVKQELWGILLTYNLIRYQMTQMCMMLKGDYLPYQLSFNGALDHIMSLIIGLPYSSSGTLPRQLKNFYDMT